MNSILLAAVLFFIAPFQSDSPVQEQHISSSVTEATVFLSGAQVTRTVEVDLEPGINHITFSGLSNTLNEQSIRISPSRPITLLSLRKDIAQSGSTAKLDSLRNLLDKVSNDIRFKNAEQKVLDYELDILLNNKDLNGENDKISAIELKQAMAFFKEKLTEIEKGRIEVQNEITALDEERAEIKERINEIVRKQNRSSAEIATEMESAEAGKVTFRLSYLVPAAGWSPSYDVRVNDITEPMQMSYKADIYQNTGIDWNDVQLSVSSAEPRSSMRIPNFNPDYLSFYTPERKKMPPPSMMEAERKRTLDLDADIDASYSRGPRTSLSQNMTSFSFDIRVPYSIEGDGSRKTVTVQEHELQPEYRYYAIPMENETAYLTAQLTGWEELNLLPGQMNLYFNQTFVGRSGLQPAVAGDTLKFSLGKDKAITVERKRVKEFSEKNFFGSKVRETSGWRLAVKNDKKEAITLELIDQVPVSTNEDIQVTVKDQSGASLEKETGKVSWMLNITAGRTVEKELRYEIEYPSGKIIQHNN